MKIFGLMVLKNEGDIVGQTLEAALAWCDRIAILDNDSDDGSLDYLRRQPPDLLALGNRSQAGRRSQITKRLLAEPRCDIMLCRAW